MWLNTISCFRLIFVLSDETGPSRKNNKWHQRALWILNAVADAIVSMKEWFRKSLPPNNKIYVTLDKCCFCCYFNTSERLQSSTWKHDLLHSRQEQRGSAPALGPPGRPAAPPRGLTASVGLQRPLVPKLWHLILFSHPRTNELSPAAISSHRLSCF